MTGGNFHAVKDALHERKYTERHDGDLLGVGEC